MSNRSNDRIETVNTILQFGCWILLIIGTITLLAVGFGDGIASAKVIGIINCIFFGIGILYLFARWIANR